MKTRTGKARSRKADEALSNPDHPNKIHKHQKQTPPTLHRIVIAPSGLEGLGHVAIQASSENRLVSIDFCHDPVTEELADHSNQNQKAELPQCVRDAALELTDYFQGKRRDFPKTEKHILDAIQTPKDNDNDNENNDNETVGTAFQRSVWRQLLRIPYGHSCTYSDVAKAIGSPKAVRAVGNANGKNPWCIVVPCHRVVASNGKLGGYSSGMARKQLLLNHEKKNLPSIA